LGIKALFLKENFIAKSIEGDMMMLKRPFMYLLVVSTLMFAGCRIQGVIVDGNGVGLAGVTVALSGAGLSRSTTTDSNGLYYFGDLAQDDVIPAGTYTVTPSSSSYSFSPASRDVTLTTVVLGNFGEVLWPVLDANFTGSTTGASTRYWGVFVGISDYQAVDDLQMAADDATSVYNLLLQDSHWNDSRMTLLVNSQATRAAVQNAIETMASSSDDDDVCLFFFSGHGGQASEDFSPYDEADAKDEYLVMWDSNIYDYSGDFVDDDLGNTLGLIRGTTVVLLDACYSGGHLKAVQSKQGEGKLQTQRKIKFAKKPFEQFSGSAKNGDGLATDLTGRRNLKDANDQSHVIILTSSSDSETSSENIGFGHGEFTYFLLLALKSNDENGNGYVSAEESFAYLSPALEDYSRSTVHPQLYDGTSGEIDLIRSTAERLVFIGHGDFSWVYPFNPYYKKRRAEYIYTQSQLGGQGYITALKIFADEKPPISFQNCTIRMKHTTQNSYDPAPQWTSSDWTTVYSGTKAINDEGPVSFELSPPFQYDGSRNLIMDFSFSNPSYAGNEGLFYGSYADNTYPMIYHRRDDDVFGPPTTWAGVNPAPTRDENSPYGSYLDLELEFSTSAP